MKSITPEQAQHLANILGMFITVDRIGCVEAYHSQPQSIPYSHLGVWAGMQPIELPIRITDPRPWTEQIWRPEV